MSDKLPQAIFVLLFILLCGYVFILLLALADASISPDVQRFIVATGGRRCWIYSSIAIYLTVATLQAALGSFVIIIASFLAFKKNKVVAAGGLIAVLGLMMMMIEVGLGCQ
jgi:hypothetical protein